MYYLTYFYKILENQPAPGWHRWCSHGLCAALRPAPARAHASGGSGELGTLAGSCRGRDGAALLALSGFVM